MRKLITILILLAITEQLSAQVLVNGDSIPVKNVFGFNGGLNTSDYFHRSRDFSLGVSWDRNLTNHLIFRPEAMISFGSYKVRDDVHVESTFLEVPMDIVLKTRVRKNSPYVYCGPALKVDLAAGSGAASFLAECGLGIERSLQYFTIAPEFRISFGREIRTVSFVLNFKG